MSIYYIGLSTSGHDPSFSIVNEDGDALFAEATERYLQDKRAWGCLPDHKSHVENILLDIIKQDSQAQFKIATSWKTIKAELPVKASVNEKLVPVNMGEWVSSLQAFVQRNAGIHCKMILKEKILSDILHFDHHSCHATAAVYSAPFDNGVCLILDGEGEVGSASLFDWKNGILERKWRSWGPGSLGVFYRYITEICGFSSVEGEEWKVMGLASYGKIDKKLVKYLRKLILIEDGRPILNSSNELEFAIDELKKYQRKSSDSIMNAANLAASGQFVYSELANKIICEISKYNKNFILSGGCALNSSFNGTILLNHAFDNVHIPCAPADDGNSLGAAVLLWQQDNKMASLPFNKHTPFLGNSVNTKKLKGLIDNSGLIVKKIDIEDTNFIAEKLSQGFVIGVMKGRAEFGPRALGNRSILADPRIHNMKERINEIVKGREGYRPFAPVIAWEEMEEWFENPQFSPYMSFTLRWKENKKELVPAVVHKDGTGRAQTVCNQTYPWLYKLIQSFKDITGVPILLNTSFNVMGKPIIHSVEDAISVLHTTGLNAILIEDYFIEKSIKK